MTLEKQRTTEGNIVNKIDRYMFRLESIYYKNIKKII